MEKGKLWPVPYFPIAIKLCGAFINSSTRIVAKNGFAQINAVQFILMFLMAIFLLASLGRFCFEWTFHHRQILKECEAF